MTDKLEQSKKALEDEKIVCDKQVREFTYKLEMRDQDLEKKDVSRQHLICHEEIA